MHKVLVNRLGGLSLPRKSVVRLTDCPYMPIDVYRGRKTTTTQQQQQPKEIRNRGICSRFLFGEINKKIPNKSMWNWSVKVCKWVNSLTLKKHTTKFSSANFQKMLSPSYIILRTQRLECKQCRSRWGGSSWATSSRTMLFANLPIFVSGS